MKKYNLEQFNAGSPEAIRQVLNERESQTLSKNAVLSSDGLRRHHEEKLGEGYRQPFSQDVDRILHSLAYTRYIDKTQVFYLIDNDHITHRVLHVQLVSKIARTVGRFLMLNEDLIEAIALGHDIGHTPFGHDGERILSEICQSVGIGAFHHNVQSVQFLDKVERKGRGWNLCLQTLDGIMCHDGEVHNQTLNPIRKKTFKKLDHEAEAKKHQPGKELIPMTLEGCIVRMADTIGYIGRDFEDAIRLGMIQRQDLPAGVKKLLGDTNGTIVYNLVTDVIQNSFESNRIAFSPEVADVLKRFKAFNLERIYMNPSVKTHLVTIKHLFEFLFEKSLQDLVSGNQSSVIFTRFLNGMSDSYLSSHTNGEIVRDFIAGMTDKYFLRQFPEAMRPKSIGS